MNSQQNLRHGCNRYHRWPHAPRLLALLLAFAASAAQAATITVNSLLDDVFPDATGAIFDVGGAPVTLAASKCTLRMAIASANLDVAVGGANGCVAGDSESGVSQANGYADQIVFTSGLAGTINVNVSKLMSEAPAVYRNNAGVPTPNATSALVVSRPLNISGNFVGTTPTPAVTLDGGLLANSSANARIMAISEGDSTSDMRVGIVALAFANARTVTNTGGCMFSRESLTMSYVTFTNCVSDGDVATGNGYGGALAMFTSRNTAVSTNPVPQARPSLTLNTVSFTNNKALRGTSTTGPSGGGAMALGFSSGYVGHIVMNTVTVNGNQADNYGGVVIRNAQSVSITNSDFTGNQAIGSRDPVNTALNSGFGGGMLIRSGNLVSIVNTRITNNSAGQGQGGLDVSSTPDFHASDLVVTGNSASSSVSGTYVSDGGIRLNSVSNVTGNRWNVSNNSVVGDPTAGGNFAGLNIQGSLGTVVLRDILVAGNTCTSAASCAAAFSNNASVDIKGYVSRNNVSTKVGTAWTGNSGIAVGNNTSFRLSDAEITGNITGDNEIVALRASFTDYTGNPPVARTTLPPLTNTILIENSSIYGNTARGSLMVYAATPGVYTLRNITVTGNTVSGGGGLNADLFAPFSAANAVQVSLQNSTISRNNSGNTTALGTSAYNGTSNGAANGKLVVESSILGRQAVGNTVAVINPFDPASISLSKTLVEDNANSLSPQCNTNGNLCNTNPLLDVLALNGGPTPTMRLLPGSPALNAGSNPANLTTDQRGAARVVGAAADMGAFESSPIVAGNCNLDMDGNNVLDGMKEGLVLLRAMLGFTGAATTAGTGITAAQWNTARPLINTNCGTAFP